LVPYRIFEKEIFEKEIFENFGMVLIVFTFPENFKPYQCVNKILLDMAFKNKNLQNIVNSAINQRR